MTVIAIADTSVRSAGRTRRCRRGVVPLAMAVASGVLAAAPAAWAEPGPATHPDTGSATASGPARSGITSGVAVFDRRTATFTERRNANRRFRSASVVKLLIALDYLWDRGPGYSMPATDRARLQGMLRRSDDDAASHYWVERGGSAIVDRMVARLDLRDTAPPPQDYPGYWGYTATSPADTVRIYRYLLDSAPDPVRTFVMGNLHHSERCGADGYDQSFGIPSVFAGPWSAKQGWSGFDSGGCTNITAPSGAPNREAPAHPASASQSDHPQPAATDAGDEIDLTSEALHSTGTVGPDDRSIVAVFTLQARGTSYGSAYSAVTRLVGSLDVPGGRRREGTVVSTYGRGVRVRAQATTDAAALTTLPAGVDVLISCQERGQTVTENGYTNPWWSYVPLYDGYLTNIYLSVASNKVPGVPECS